MPTPFIPANAPEAIIRFSKGRGAGNNQVKRFSAYTREQDRDFLDHQEDEGGPPRPRTVVTPRAARSIISRNASPDLAFSQSINPYEGCEHGCSYCYARPTHAYLGLSPGLDFETKIFSKPNAAELLRAELSRPSYVPSMIALGANTDPYQPIERELQITRQVLQVLAECHLPVAITTKSALVVRDLDILAPMAAKGLVRVHVSLGTLDHTLARRMEPRANSPTKRLEAIARLAAAQVPVGVFSSPIIPALNDAEMESVLKAARDAGASSASYIILRLPLEVRDIFVQWLHEHYPLKADHVMNLIRQMRDGQDYDADFRVRMRGTGEFAKMLAHRFKIAARRLGLNADRASMDVSQFRRPSEQTDQLDLF